MADGKKERELTARHGVPWSDEENARLVAGVRRGLVVAELAREYGRSTTAIVSQLAKMTVKDGAGVPEARPERAEWVRQRLVTDAGYEWRAGLRSWLSEYWSGEDDEELRREWEQGTHMNQLVRRFGVPESRVHRRLMFLGLSDGVVATVDRLGCAEGGALHARYRRARGIVRDVVATLVIYGEVKPAGSRFGPGHGAAGPAEWTVCWVSSHASRDAARAELHKVTAGARSLDVGQSGPFGRLRWVITVRGMGQPVDSYARSDERGELPAAR